tara:strand:- start:778 stop:951 length:174 start_codon:yes stop_codon:yes gene_type:complete
MTTQNPAERQPTTAPWTMALYRLDPVGTAAGNESTPGTDKRRNPLAIKANERKQHGA